MRAIARVLFTVCLGLSTGHAADALPREDAIRYVLTIVRTYGGDWDAAFPDGISVCWKVDQVPEKHRAQFLRAQASVEKAGKTFLLKLKEGETHFSGMEFGRLPGKFPSSMREKHLPPEKIANLTAEDWADINLKYAIGLANSSLWYEKRMKIGTKSGAR